MLPQFIPLMRSLNTAVPPRLNLNFLTGDSLDPRITFSRGSTATYFDQLGVLQTAAINTARFDYNPSTLAAQGLLIEEQRTNLLLRSQEFGTSWIRFGTTTLTENTSVAPDGTTTGDNIVFTSASAGIYQIVTGAALTTYTFSVWIKSSSSTQVRIVINTNLSDPTVQSVAVTSGWQRVSISKTTAVGTTSVTAQIQDDGSGNTQFDIWGAQLEAGAFATSYIPTTTTALTRNADVAAMTGTNFSSWYNQSAGTFFTIYSLARPSSGSNQFTCRASDNGYNNQLSINTSTTGFPSIATASGGVFDGLATAVSALTANVFAKVAGCYATNDLALSLNGAAVVTDTSATIPTNLTRFDIGSDHAGFNRIQGGYIQRIAYYPVRLPNSTLQALTA